jgi:hypothetical protein
MYSYGNSYLIANRGTVDDWEKFYLIPNEDGSYAIKAKVNMKYVSGYFNGILPLLANQGTIGDYESFFITPLSGTEPNVYDWVIYKPDNIFGQIADNTLDSFDGHFIIANGKNVGDFSRIYSENLPPTSESGVCMTFYYYFYGGKLYFFYFNYSFIFSYNQNYFYLK